MANSQTPVDQMTDLLTSGPAEHTQFHVPFSRGAVSNVSLAVAYRDMAVACRNMADLTRYLDIQSTLLAACSGALDDNLPMMSVDTFPHVTGGIRSALDETCRDQEELVADQDRVSYGTRH